MVTQRRRHQVRPKTARSTIVAAVGIAGIAEQEVAVVVERVDVLRPAAACRGGRSRRKREVEHRRAAAGRSCSEDPDSQHCDARCSSPSTQPLRSMNVPQPSSCAGIAVDSVARRARPAAATTALRGSIGETMSPRRHRRPAAHGALVDQRDLDRAGPPARADEEVVDRPFELLARRLCR